MNLVKQVSSYGEKIDSCLQRIANQLFLNASFIDNIGLLNGKMGIAIFFYHYSRYTGNKIYGDYAGELIDEIYEEINTNTPVDFANGLTGIGWGIEYLVKSKFLEADTDEALSEIDNAIYRSRINSPILINDGKDLFGYGLYYIMHLTGGEICDDDLNTLMKKYHLIFLTDECERILIQKHYKRFNIESLSVDTINSFIWFLLEMHRLEIFPYKSEKVLQAVPGFIDDSLRNNDDIAGTGQLLSLTGFMLPYINDLVTKDSLAELLQSSFLKVNLKELSDEILVDSFVKKTWQKIVYEPYVSSNMESVDTFNKIFSIIDNEEGWNRRLDNLNKNNIGLTGLSGIGMGLIFQRMMGESRSTKLEIRTENNKVKIED